MIYILIIRKINKNKYKFMLGYSKWSYIILDKEFNNEETIY